MKKYILGLTIAASTLSLVGCSDFLDTPVLGQQDLSEYFVNEDQCKQQITGCYQSIFWDDWWQVQKFYLCGDMCTDECVGKDWVNIWNDKKTPNAGENVIVMRCHSHYAALHAHVALARYTSSPKISRL